jgi:hypothetical protein
VIITVSVGLRIFIQYFKYREINLFYIGLAWLGIATPYFPEFMQFLFLMTGESHIPEGIYFLYFLLNIADLPLFLILWLAGITNMLNINKKKRKSLLVIVIILSILIEILLFYFYFSQRSIIGVIVDNAYRWAIFPTILLYSILVVILITGLMFAREALKAEGEIKLKGQLLLIAFLIFVIGAILDTVTTIEFITVLIIARLLITSGSIFFYMGYLLPDWVKNIFLKIRAEE